jgi:hypothetical protein
VVYAAANHEWNCSDDIHADYVWVEQRQELAASGAVAAQLQGFADFTEASISLGSSRSHEF